VIVLKLGGSVLADEAALELAVHELYRWWRSGTRVVAVVSALRGVTEALLERLRPSDAGADADAPAAAVAAGDAHARAALLATGEASSAALLALALERAGVPSCVLAPAALGLVAEGPPLDGQPVSLEPQALHAAHARDELVIVPGWCAVDAAGRPMLLGRGGSDLSALFLAQELGASRCRLLKDVDGLYERDPRRSGPAPRRFALAAFADALATDGSIVQHKAVRYAQRHGMPFELGAWLDDVPTRLGPGPGCFAPRRGKPRPLRLALLGLGAVGSELLRLARALPGELEVVAIAVRDLSRPRVGLPQGVLLSDDACAVARCGADVVLELMGGVSLAGQAQSAALLAGSHVVTANKALIAERGPALRGLARRCARRLVFAAAVGGAMPLLERLTGLGRDRVRGVRAVLNGTTNAVLESLAAGLDLERALADARRAGYAEADCSRDLSGQDAADKLCLLASALGVRDLAPGDIACDVLDADVVARWLRGAGAVAVGAVGAVGVHAAHAMPAAGEAQAVPPGRVEPALHAAQPVMRQVAELDLSEGVVRASVRLVSVDAVDPLAHVSGAGNAASVTLVDGTQRLVRGCGAGGRPTAEAVLADVLALRAVARGVERTTSVSAA